jgi:phage-related protein
VQLSNAATKAVNGKLGAAAEQFLTSLDGVAREAIKKYFNKKITGQTNEEINTWLQKNVSGKQYKNLVGEGDGYLYQNADGYEALTATWNAIYQYKVNLADQLEKQVKGFEQWTGGQKAGEGFVVNTSVGLVKLVNRGVFGVAHFNK